jgi:hypothetical protein
MSPLFYKNRYAFSISAAVSAVILSLLLTSCEEPVKLDLGQTPSKITIEGLVTNHTGYQYVKVKRSSDFYAAGKTPRVTDANVTVSDNLGNIYTFVHNPHNNSDSVGTYIPQTPFVGVIGRTYTLSVDVDGNNYTAKDELFRVTPIDSLTAKVNADEEKDPELEGRIYNVLLFTKEPRNEKNFYYFKFFRNDSLTYDNDTDIYFSDDEFLGEKIDGVESPVLYSRDDVSRVEMYSISRTGYVYYNDLSNLLNNDAGGMFGPIPASPRTNLTNGALGFFQVSAVDFAELNVEYFCINLWF